MENILKLFLFFLILTITIACSGDGDVLDNSIDITNKGYLKAIYKNGNLKKEYSYYDNGKLKMEKKYQKSFEYTYLLDTVYRKGIDCPQSDSDCKDIKFYKMNDNIIKDEITQFGTLYSSSKYIFTDQCSYVTLNEYDSLGNLDNKKEYDYIENCGYIESYYNENDTFMHKINVKKDEHIAFNQKIQVSLFDLELHNIIEYEYITASGEIIPHISYYENFTYNNDGFPISSSRTYYNGNIVNYVYEYY